MGNLFGSSNHNYESVPTNNVMKGNKVMNMGNNHNSMNDMNMSKDQRRDVNKQAMNQAILSNSNKVQHVGMPTGVYAPLGMAQNDPLNNFQHICDKCKYKQIQRNHEYPLQPGIDSMSTDVNAPRPYDPTNYLNRNVNVCYTPDGMTTECVLE
jgi:hypothetical protein